MLHTAKQMKPPSFWESLRARFFTRDGEGQRFFSEIDYYRLQGLLTRQRLETYVAKADQLRQLRQMLTRGMLYPCKAIPSDLVTMNSVVLLRSRRGSGFQVGLVYPRDADRKSRKFSVLSALGLALIGRVEGERLPSGLVVEKILYQPERLGNYYL